MERGGGPPARHVARPRAVAVRLGGIGLRRSVEWIAAPRGELAVVRRSPFGRGGVGGSLLFRGRGYPRECRGGAREVASLLRGEPWADRRPRGLLRAGIGHERLLHQNRDRVCPEWHGSSRGTPPTGIGHSGRQRGQTQARPCDPPRLRRGQSRCEARGPAAHRGSDELLQGSALRMEDWAPQLRPHRLRGAVAGDRPRVRRCCRSPEVQLRGQARRGSATDPARVPRRERGAGDRRGPPRPGDPGWRIRGRSPLRVSGRGRREDRGGGGLRARSGHARRHLPHRLPRRRVRRVSAARAGSRGPAVLRLSRGLGRRRRPRHRSGRRRQRLRRRPHRLEQLPGERGQRGRHLQPRCERCVRGQGQRRGHGARLRQLHRRLRRRPGPGDRRRRGRQRLPDRHDDLDGSQLPGRTSART